ncbi:YhaN family protein [soil metagenome]
MRLAKLYLKAFGPYTERVIELDASGASLHLLYGPNEAGKSSLLRAIRALFFGIPERTLDNFLHGNTTLRVGGVIIDSDGHPFPLMRRKARKQPLREWNGEVGNGADCESRTLPDDAISTCFDGIGEAQFSRLFGIDRNELIAGGQAILEGRGDVGESLFEAGAGLVDLRRLRAALETEAGELFAPRASKPLINSTLGAYEAAKRETRECAVKTEEWSRREDACHAAFAALDANKKTIADQRLKRERLGRILRNLPLLGWREECLKELGPLSGVPDLGSAFAEKRAAAVAATAHAIRQREDAGKKVAELEARLESVKISAGYIERGALIQGIYSRLGAFQQAEIDIPLLRATRFNRLDQAQASLAGMGFTGDLNAAESLRLKKGDETRLRGLIKDHADLSGRLAELKRGETDMQVELEEAEHVLSESIPSKGTEPLEETVQIASEHGASERRLTELENEIQRRLQELKRKTRSLGERTATELRDLRPPSKATLQRLEQKADDISSERKILISRLSQRRRDLAQLAAEKGKIEGRGPVPSAGELAKAREHRDLGWKLVRQGYIERSADADNLSAGFSHGATLPEAYESAVLRADAVADGLRHDTQRMTEHAVAVERIAQLSGAVTEDQARLKDLSARQEAWQREWSAVTDSLGVSYATVRETEAWLVERANMVASLAEIEARQWEADGIRNTVTAVRRRLAAALTAHGIDAVEMENLSALLIKARKRLEKARTEVTDHEKAGKAVEVLRLDLAGQTRRITLLEVDRGAWRSRWRPAAIAIGLGETAEPVDAEGQLDLLDEVFRAIDEAHRLGLELSAREGVVRRYAEEIHGVATALGVNMEEHSLGDVAALLFAQHQEARNEAQRQEQLSAQLGRERLALEKADHDAEIKTRELADLCLAAGVAEVGELAPVEECAGRKRERSLELSQIEKQLIEQNSVSLDRVLAEAACVDRDKLAVRIGALDREIEDAEAARITLAQRVRDAEVAMQEIDGSAKAAEAAQTVQELLARLRQATEDYARLKISSFVIGRAIEAYREKNQGPLLTRATDYFATLTLGSFRGLEVDFSEDDRQVLVGVRNNYKLVAVDAMSEGTRDQLYLALRLAAIERHLQAGPPLPVIVDDILVQFDDERARAAFKALGMLAAHTQVLVLTHHGHLVRLAEESTAKGVLAVHRLEILPGVSAGNVA